MQKFWIRNLVIAVAVAASLVVPLRADVVVDNFDERDATATVNGGGPTAAWPDPFGQFRTTVGTTIVQESVFLATDVIGGVRETFMSLTHFNGGISGTLIAGIDVLNSGFLSFAASDFVNGAITLNYDGLDDGLIGTGGTAILGTGAFATCGFLSVDILALDRGLVDTTTPDIFVDFILTFEDGSGNIESETIVVTTQIAATTSLSFILANFGSIDFTDINRVTLTIDPDGRAADFTIDLVAGRPFPEPTSMALAFLGLATLGGAAARKKLARKVA